MTDVLVEELFDLGQDPELEDLIGMKRQERVAVIRTSDRTGFKRCRRRWGWSSHLRGNLAPREAISPLWFGSGFHYALEDFHGYRQYASPIEAFNDYVRATHKQAKLKHNRLPPDWMDLTLLGRQMLDYYANYWLIARDPFETFVWQGRPQVEVHILVEVPFKSPHYDRILYACTLDRVVQRHNGLFIIDYKTAKQIQTHFFQTDPQISAYHWLASTIYGQPIAGFIYQQHLKRFPESPRILSNGTISTSDRQTTSHRHYRKALQNLYGDINKAPRANIDFLNELAAEEGEFKDRFVRRDFIFRNAHQGQAEGAKVLLELEEMLNPDLPLYPNPTRDCGHMCPFNSACVSMDDGSDWQNELELLFEPKNDAFDSWREYLPAERQLHYIKPEL